MTHSSWKTNPDYASFTPCQIDLALEELTGGKCELIEAINSGCPPPSAFIDLPPTIDTINSCGYCLILEGSTNDNDHKISLEVQSQTGWQPFISGNWTAGPATKFCVAIDANVLFINNVSHLLTPNTQYRLQLETRNLCGDTDIDSYVFTSSQICDLGGTTVPNDPTVFESFLTVWPNPRYQGARLDYEMQSTGDVQVYLSRIGVTQGYQSPQHIPEASGTKDAGSHQVIFNANELVHGLNYIIIQVDGATFARPVFKY
jgi:hypothetical protein